ncbi:hypothetical protein H2203_000162 [Taxawa tesnikishii (nom. ined.)]|nr:hypothetical protein H2203_000162 [Dothideales sp. JES 119]
MRSFALVSALAGSLLQVADARVADHNVRQAKRDMSDNPQHGILDRIRNIFHREPVQLAQRQDQEVCVYDDYLNGLSSLSSLGTAFCSQWISVEAATVTEDYTPTVTATDTFSTSISTTTILTRVTPVETATTTSTTTIPAGVKRDAQTTAAARLIPRDADAIALFVRDVLDIGSATQNATMAASLSSACSCMDIPQTNTTVTYTNEATTATLSARVDVVTTVTTTRTAATQTTTTTVLAAVPAEPTPLVYGSGVSAAPQPSVNSTEAPSTTVAGTAPTPTSPAFTCPDDDGQIVSQMINNERFDFLVQCNTDLTDPDLPAMYSYPSFAQCVAACALTDYGFDNVTCQAAVFYPTTTSEPSGCFLKQSAHSNVSATGVHAAILQRVAVAVSNNASDTATPFAPASSTAGAVDTASMLSSIMANSTSDMPMITPAPVMSGRAPNVGAASTVTYTSGGSIYYQTVYSTYYSANGSWYESYYISWTSAWSSSSAIVGSAEGSGSAGSGANDGNGAGGESGTNTITTTTTTNNGAIYETVQNSTTVTEYGGISNVTEIITTTYSYPNGSTSQNVTTYDYSYGTANGSNGSQNGGASGNGNSTTTVTVTNTTIITNSTSGNMSGGNGSETGGNIGSGASNSTTSTLLSTVIVNTYTAGSTGGVISGGGSGGVYNTAASGAITPSGNITAPSSTTTVGPGTEGNRSGTVPPDTTTTIPELPTTSSVYGGPPSSPTSGMPTPSDNTSVPIGPTGISNTSIPVYPSTGPVYSFITPTISLSIGTAPSGIPTLPTNGTYPSGPTGTGSIPSSIPGFPSTSGGYVPQSSPSSSSTTTQTFTNSQRDRTPNPYGPSTLSVPVYPSTAPSYPGLPSTTGAGTSGLPIPSSNTSSTPGPTSPTFPSYPSFTPSSGTGFSSYPSPTPNTTFPSYPTGGPTSPPANVTSYPTGGSTSPVSSSSTSELRSGTASTTTPFPLSSSTCIINALGTTTMWETVTVSVCGPSCPPVNYGAGYYGGFGAPPPFFGAPTATNTNPAR